MNPFVGLDSMDVVKQKEFSFRWTNLTPFLCVFRTFSRQGYSRCLLNMIWNQANCYFNSYCANTSILSSVTSSELSRKSPTEEPAFEHPTCREGQYGFDQDTSAVPISSGGAVV